MKKSKWADWLVVIGFLGFLALALAVTLVRPKSGWSYYENRNLARPAELSMETVLDGTFPASVEPVLQDHAAGRNTLMKLSAWADLHLFHRPVVNEVVPSDGMLLGFNAYETPDPAVIDNQAQAMAGQLAQLRDVVEGTLLLRGRTGAVHLFLRFLPGLPQQPGGVHRLGNPRLHPGHGGAGGKPSGHGAGAGPAGKSPGVLLPGRLPLPVRGGLCDLPGHPGGDQPGPGAGPDHSGRELPHGGDPAQPLSGLPGEKNLRAGELRGAPDHRPAQGPHPLHPLRQRHRDGGHRVRHARHRHGGRALLPLHGGRCGGDRH